MLEGKLKRLLEMDESILHYKMAMNPKDRWNVWL